MRQQDLISLAYDYLSLLTARVGTAKIRRVVLFGSAARDEADKESDIDIFIDTTDKIDHEVERATKSFDVIRESRWDIKGVRNPLRPICGDLETKRWAELREEMEDHGILLYGRMETGALKEQYLVSYDLQGMAQNKKMKLIRTLHGYSTRKDGKTYSHKGLIEKTGGARIGQNAFLAPTCSKKTIEETFDKTGAKFQMRKMMSR